MKKVEEMCMKLGNASGTPLKSTDVLMVGINGAKSKLLFSDFVKGYSHDENEIKGFSFLFQRDTILVDNRIKINEDILVSLFRQSDEEEIVITKIFPHWFQGNDKEVDNDLQLQIIREEYLRMTAEVIEEVDELSEEIKEEPTAEETAPVVEQKTEDGYKSNTHKAICILGAEAVEIARGMHAETGLNEQALDNIVVSLNEGGSVFEMESENEKFKDVKQKAKAAAQYLGAAEPVQFKYTQEVSDFLHALALC